MSPILNKMSVFSHHWEFTVFIFPFQHMQVLGDTMSSPLCGMLPVLNFSLVSGRNQKILFLIHSSRVFNF
jgi:hypothetical protein